MPWPGKVESTIALPSWVNPVVVPSNAASGMPYDPRIEPNRRTRPDRVSIFSSTVPRVLVTATNRTSPLADVTPPKPLTVPGDGPAAVAAPTTRAPAATATAAVTRKRFISPPRIAGPPTPVQPIRFPGPEE